MTKWYPARFIPLLSGQEIIEGYKLRGSKLDRVWFKNDIIISLVMVDIIIVNMMRCKL